MTYKDNIIAIVSPKGGVGKTVTTANLAAALALVYDKKVLAVDTNVSTASLGMHFDIFYPEHTIHDVSGKSKSEKAVHVYHQNLHLIPASIKVRKKFKDPKKVHKSLLSLVKRYENFLKKVSKNYDLVLLDCSPGFDLETLAAMHVAGGMIVVTNPDYPSVSTAARAVEYAKKIKMPVGGIVLNKVKNKKYELNKKDIEDVLGMEIIQEVPYDKHVHKSIAKKKPVVLSKKNSKSGKAFQKLAADLIGEEYSSSWLKDLTERIKTLGK